MEIRFVCARKGVVLSPSAAATHTRVNFVKKANTNYYKLFFHVSFVHFFPACVFSGCMTQSKFESLEHYAGM